MSQIILSIKNGEMHLIAEDMENLHIHGAPRQTEKAKEPDQKPIPPYSLYFEEALAGMRKGKKYRCREWLNPRAQPSPYSKKHLEMGRNASGEDRIYMVQPGTGYSREWDLTDIEMFGMWEEVTD